MTIRTGETFVIETLDQFLDRLNATVYEIVNALDSDIQREILTEEQEGTADEYNPESITDIPTEEVREHIEVREIDLNTIIQNTLEDRSREYTHVYDNPVHRIIELQPKKEPVTPAHLS